MGKCGPNMTGIQLYVSKELAETLEKSFGKGKISANIERVMRFYLGNPVEEKKLRLRELMAKVRRFEADYAVKIDVLIKDEVKP